MSFTQKRIVVRITLVDAGTFEPSQTVSFDESGTNTVELSGYRVSATITKAGGASQGEAQLRIYGLSLSLMNQLSTLGRTPIAVRKNLIQILAGDDVGLSQVFSGAMYLAYTDLGGPPEGMLDVSASSMLLQSVQSILANSFRGTVDAALVLQQLAGQMNLRFENNGVSVMLSNPNFPGSALTQAKRVIEHAGIEWNSGDNGVLAIWPRGGHRDTTVVPLISPATGMVGYPYPSGEGCMGVKTAFNPGIFFGGLVRVESDIKPACGTWVVNQLIHEIESEMPGGQWMTSLMLRPLEFEVNAGARQ